jgi:CRP-like cAMP-binding protein
MLRPGSKNTSRAPRNLLLSSLAERDFKRLSSCLTSVPLRPRRVLQYAGVVIEHVYFIEEGMVSVQTKADEAKAVEVWLVGREGIVGLPTVFGLCASPHQRVVQIGGRALALSAQDLQRLMSEMPSLREILLRYAFAVLMQATRVSACNLCHSASQRVTRWLLSTADRCDGLEVPVSQERLARCLGLRRASVCKILAEFQGQGLLIKRRNLITIRNRTGLMEISCQCYRAICKEQEQVSYPTLHHSGAPNSAIAFAPILERLGAMVC